METPAPVVAPISVGVVPSATFSNALINAIMTAYVESAETIEEIANLNNISISQVLQCLDEQAPFLRNMLNTLESRVRIIAARAEAVAIETLRDVATFAREQESRRKAASKLLSHFAQRTKRASVGTRAPAHPRGTTATQPASPPSPRLDGEKPPSTPWGGRGG